MSNKDDINELLDELESLNEFHAQTELLLSYSDLQDFINYQRTIYGGPSGECAQ